MLAALYFFDLPLKSVELGFVEIDLGLESPTSVIIIAAIASVLCIILMFDIIFRYIDGRRAFSAALRENADSHSKIKKSWTYEGQPLDRSEVLNKNIESFAKRVFILIFYALPLIFGLMMIAHIIFLKILGGSNVVQI